MEQVLRLRRLKKRNILVISAASLHSGVQFLYLHTEKSTWTVVEYQVSPYLQKIRSQIAALQNNKCDGDTLKKIAWLDHQLSIFYLDSARSFLSLLPRHAQKPDLIILNRFALWNDLIEDEAGTNWNLPIGDPQMMAQHLGVPVLTDFIRHDILNSGKGHLPVIEGDKWLAESSTNTTVFINIGLLSQVTIISNDRVIDSHAGPGTCLINRAAMETGAAEGFDRDGSLAQTGTVDTDCLERLASTDWFKKPAPKFAKVERFDALYMDPCLQKLSSLDRLSTVTALTARTISNFYRNCSSDIPPPEVIYISGGGVNNMMLAELLGAYLSPVPVRSVEEIGIPTEGRIPLSLGLTVENLLQKKSWGKRSGGPKGAPPLGKWVIP